MISLERRDAREELGLGFVGGGEMEDTDFEEGEAYAFHNNNDDGGFDASVDPDISLSYIDEKLQDVLGHFQKDFEGGVSAENLGAKFGGYGSFLPAYQHSPVWSHPRTPQKTLHYSSSRSPSNLQTKGGFLSHVYSSTVPRSLKLEPAPSCSVSLPVSKVSSSLIDSFIKDSWISSSYMAEELAPTKNKIPDNLADQKMLKVRIKVGSDNLSLQKSAAIYSGLGLDVSPSSSLDDSPSECEGISHRPQETSFESPAQIIQIMTSLPVLGGQLLSPLLNDLIHLTEKEKPVDDNGTSLISRAGPDQSVTLVNGSDCVKGHKKIVRDKKKKSLKTNENLSELQSKNKRGSQSSIAVTSHRERDLDVLACEELVSNALKISALSNSYRAVADKSKGTGGTSNLLKELDKVLVKEKSSSDVTKEESVASMFTQDDGHMENQNGTSTGKVWVAKKDSSTESVSGYPKKDGHCSVEKPDNSVKIDSDVSKGSKTPNPEPGDYPKQKTDQKAKSLGQEVMKSHSRRDSSFSELKKKMKGSQSHDDVIAGIPKGSSEIDPSIALKSEKRTYSNKYPATGGLGDSKLQKSAGKASDKYREFFGDIEPEKEEDTVSPPEMCYRERLNDSNVVERSMHETDMLKGRLSSKKIHKLSTSQVYVEAAPSGALHSGNGQLLDAAPSAAASVLIEENWVCCDKCQKWRLLPIGKNPVDLPEKWVCSMLNWLPSMNRCSFSEEETKNALIALYQVPAPDSQTILHSNLGEVASKVSLAGIHLNQNFQNMGIDVMPTGAKENHSSKESSNAARNDGSVQLSNFVKNNNQVSMETGRLNDVNQSPMVRETEFMKRNKSSNLTVENQSHKQKDKHKVLDTCSGGGNVKRLKMKSKKDCDKDPFRASKKLRTGDLGEEYDHVGATEKVSQSLSNGLSAMSSGKHLPKYCDHSSKDSKYGQKDWPQVSAKKAKDKIGSSIDDGSLDVGICDNRNGSKKRKMKESCDAQIYLGSITNSGHKLQNSMMLAKKEFSECEQTNKKKARLFRSEGWQSSTSRGNSRTGKNGNFGKNKQVGQDPACTVSQQILDGVGSSRIDSGSLHPSVAATSSSSKVSGSHKTKANFPDVKGSPVESVSSLPVEVSEPDKLTSARKDPTGKDDSTAAGFTAHGGTRRRSGGEVDSQSNQSATARKEKPLGVAHQGFLESSLLDFQEKGYSCVAGGKAKIQIMPSPNIMNHHYANGGAYYSGQDTQYHGKSMSSVRYLNDEKQNESHCHSNGSHPRKPGKASSSQPRENGNFNHKTRFSGSIDEQEPSCKVKLVDGKRDIGEKSGMKHRDNENGHGDMRCSAALLTTDTSRRESQSDSGGHSGPDVKAGAIFSHDTIKQPDFEMIRGSKQLVPLASSEGAQSETLAHCLQPVSKSQKGSGSNNLAVDNTDGDNESKVPKQIRKVDLSNGIPHNSSRSSMPNRHRVRDLDASNPVKRDSSSQAANDAVNEAKNLKHTADRLKNSGSYLESTRLYFEAALKFLHGAALLERCSIESAKTGELIQSMQMYSSTAKLCKFCAYEYEKLKDMAIASLAYKCTEVAHMRVIYLSHTNANRDQHELKMALQNIPPGESPSSSASDVDNLNHPTSVDKVPLAKGVSSPQLNGSLITTARNRTTSARLLNFAQEVNSAMEASRKSQIAFAAANVSLGEVQGQQCIASIKTALNFSFHDVDRLLCLVRLAIEAINC